MPKREVGVSCPVFVTVATWAWRSAWRHEPVVFFATEALGVAGKRDGDEDARSSQVQGNVFGKLGLQARVLSTWRNQWWLPKSQRRRGARVDYRGAAGGYEGPQGGGQFRIVRNRAEVLEVYQPTECGGSDTVDDTGEVYHVAPGGQMDGSGSGIVVWWDG